MPINSIIENKDNKAEYLIDKDVKILICSSSCLLLKIDGRSRVVRTGQTEATALTVILDEDHLLVPLAGSRRSDTHILGSQNSTASFRSNWEKLIGLKNPALMPVCQVCDCMAETQIIDGLEFEDAATIPAWKKVRSILGKSNLHSDNKVIFFDQWRQWMTSLAQGLNELEKLGLAHGDPYPFNALSNGTIATWVDFGHLTDDPEQRFKDAWAFVLFTVLHTLRSSATYSPVLIFNLASVLQEADQPGIFAKIQDVLERKYEDLISSNDNRTPSMIFAKAVAEQSEKVASNSALEELLIKSSVQYFSDILHHIQRGNKYYTAFHAELQRHRFQEKEMLRLMMPKAEYENKQAAVESALAARDMQIAEYSRAKASLDEQLSLLGVAISERDVKLTSLNVAITQKENQIADLNRVVDDHSLSVLHLTQVSKSHYEHVTQLLGSNSWKITRPIRVLARFIKLEGLTDNERSKLYKHAKRIYHSIPVSYEKKLVFRKYFLKMTGWNPKNSSSVNTVGGLNTAVLISNTESNDSLSAVPVSNLSVLLKPQNLGNQVPYFGVRRPEGSQRVAILTNQLLDWNNGRPRFGGGERYALELARLLKELSFEVTFYQPSFKAPGEGEYYGFKVILLRTSDSIGEFHHGICSEFTELTKNFDHVYYHLPEYASGKVREDGLMTCHGIWFDHNNYPDAIFRTPEWFQQLYAAFSSPRCVVSVDTNSIGVIRSLWPELASNMRFIPNFYDANSYFPRPELRNSERLTILFPRRSQINRGSRIFGEIVSLIPHDVKIIWLGEGDPVDTQIIKDVCKRDSRVSFAVADFDQMPQWYQKADIAVIPTIACEGTSLSCIEALAVGCAVVSTNVGGLPDLVYDGMNGLLVDPDARSLANAINRLIIDKKLREQLQKKSFETAHHFELKSWRVRWTEVLNEYGWITDHALDKWKSTHSDDSLICVNQKPDKWLILTRNAIHGGVESLIREEAKGLNAPVIVCGGHEKKDTCPFEYTRADDPKTLSTAIAQYDVILYHWLPDWCLDVLRRSGKNCIEFVHRTDTAESDKTVPMAVVTHSAFLARHLYETSGLPCRVVDHPIAIERFQPQPQSGKFVGAITSYYDTKGIDIFLRAWVLIESQFPNLGVRFYGAGDDLPKFRKLSADLGLNVDFRDATAEPWEAMKDFACFVVPSRIEGLPVAILEALAMNIPVIASDLPGMVEFNHLSESRGYLSYVHMAKTEDVNDLASVIAKVLEKNIQLNSSEYIKTYYSREKHCVDLSSIYRELRR